MIYKLIRQQTFVGQTTEEIQATSCKENYNNGILESITFFDGDNEITIEIVVGDIYYRVLDENGNVIYKHNCGSNHNC